jgi:hypothetical protein
VIVQPTPTEPAAARRRGRRAAALAAPIALLVGAIAVGLVGQWLAAVPGPGHAPTASAPSAPAEVAAIAPGDVTPAPPAAEPTVAFPAVAADLAVRSIADAQAWLGDVTAGPVAVAGWLTDLHPLGACPRVGGDTRGVLSPLCPRRARLTDGSAGTDAAHQIYLTIPPGTRLPPALENPASIPAMTPIVVVGETGDLPHPCLGDPNECRSDLRVERVTWADGGPFDPGPIYDAYLDVAPPNVALRNLDSAETLAIGWYGTILQAALVRPSTVGRIDPVAARAMAISDTPGRLVWYVRGLETGYDPVHALHGEAPPRYSWVVLDYSSGATLARGPER